MLTGLEGCGKVSTVLPLVAHNDTMIAQSVGAAERNPL
jgi:hypothetical protein